MSDPTPPQPPATPPAAPAAAAAPAVAAKPAPPPKPEVPSRTPEEMIAPALKSFLERYLRSGEAVTVEIGKSSFTGRLFRLMLHEGWIAVEHVDGRRKAFYVYEGGSIAPATGGERLPLGGGAHGG